MDLSFLAKAMELPCKIIADVLQAVAIQKIYKQEYPQGGGT